ncbi:MAG: GntR family transcriptional regulator [Nocardioides sp.]|nr:GntR family transcriptional regulator [Nocardioides sp.]
MVPTPRPSLDRSSPLPLWAQLQEDITARIRRGEFDAAFPGELQLVEEYAVSRHTVREALRALRESGLLEGGRGRQTRVAGPSINQSSGTLYSLFAAVEASGRRQRSVVRVLDARADGVVASRLGLEESTPLVYLERVRLADDVPLALDCVWLPAQVAAPLLEADFTETSLYGELEQRCGVRLTGGQERVRAVVPTPAERRLISLPEGEAALYLERLGVQRGRPVEWRRTLIRGDRFAFEADLTSPDRITVAVGNDRGGHR